jgi:hypothetical protein
VNGNFRVLFNIAVSKVEIKVPNATPARSADTCEKCLSHSRSNVLASVTLRPQEKSTCGVPRLHGRLVRK